MMLSALNMVLHIYFCSIHHSILITFDSGGVVALLSCLYFTGCNLGRTAFHIGHIWVCWWHPVLHACIWHGSVSWTCWWTGFHTDHIWLWWFEFGLFRENAEVFLHHSYCNIHCRMYKLLLTISLSEIEEVTSSDIHFCSLLALITWASYLVF